MAWQQRRARFYCEVESARERTERLLGSDRSGLVIRAAGEYGMIQLNLYATSRSEGKHYTDEARKDGDIFMLSLQPWRENVADKGALILAEGVLNYDKQREHGTMVRLGPEVWETYNFLRAREILKGER